MAVRHYSICRDLICLGFALCEGKKDYPARIGHSANLAVKWRDND